MFTIGNETVLNFFNFIEMAQIMSISQNSYKGMNKSPQ